MRKYIVNLTNHLIGTHRFDTLANTHIGWDRFLDHVTQTLECADVKNMSPETLGRVMCSFEIGDLMVGKQEIQRRIYFAGESEETLRGLVAFFLALAIQTRLDDSEPVTDIPPYRHTRRQPIGR